MAWLLIVLLAVLVAVVGIIDIWTLAFIDWKLSFLITVATVVVAIGLRHWRQRGGNSHHAD
ncbi:hypothetical protein [Ferrimonas lipolytica]|uniref:Uncharacterized protein n=1 Tax=Ferrimonas lipolytica TaxID=2724191 RepID=A0A6H1UGQ1_9GAMM|nr:hypothetical protein [Ferrimonas lipolytica]QIZ77780.1 hypothetical protein HER31_13260 [Ferrimonas lipolytica]